MTGTNPWAAYKESEPLAIRDGDTPHLATFATVRILSNINIVHFEYGRGIISFDVNGLSNAIEALMWAKWYLTEGKYNEQTSTK